MQVDAVAEPIAGVDWRAHAHTPLQAFVLRHVDGRRSIEELSMLTGVAAEVIETLVSRLVDERALRIVGVRGGEEDESQRPTVPGVPDALVHERPTRPDGVVARPHVDSSR